LRLLRGTSALAPEPEGRADGGIETAGSGALAAAPPQFSLFGVILIGDTNRVTAGF